MLAVSVPWSHPATHLWPPLRGHGASQPLNRWGTPETRSYRCGTTTWSDGVTRGLTAFISRAHEHGRHTEPQGCHANGLTHGRPRGPQVGTQTFSVTWAHSQTCPYVRLAWCEMTQLTYSSHGGGGHEAGNVGDRGDEMWGYGEGGQLPKQGHVRDVARVAVPLLRTA